MFAHRVGPNQFKVGDYYVDLDGEETCYCPDNLFRAPKRGTPCKHTVAALAALR